LLRPLGLAEMIVTLAEIEDQVGIVRLEGKRRLEAVARVGVGAARVEAHAVLVVLAHPLLGRRRTSSDEQRQPRDEADTDHATTSTPPIARSTASRKVDLGVARSFTLPTLHILTFGLES